VVFQVVDLRVQQLVVVALVEVVLLVVAVEAIKNKKYGRRIRNYC
jgi:uncharacterized membrane protein